MTTIPYARATSGRRALDELERILHRFGCTRFGTMTDASRGELLVQFTCRGHDVQVRASWRGYAAALLKGQRATPANQARALTQAQVSVCSCVRDWVKGQVTAIETGILTFEGAFLGQLLLPSGRTVLEQVAEQKIISIEGPK